MNLVVGFFYCWRLKQGSVLQCDGKGYASMSAHVT